MPVVVVVVVVVVVAFKDAQMVVVVVVVVVVAFKDARVVGLLATDSCLLGSRVLPPITGAALPETDHSSIKCNCPKRHPPAGVVC